MKLMSIATKYPAYLQQFYAQRPGLAERPYAEQHATLMAHSFGAPENRAYAFARLGYQVEHIFANAEPMQKQWARERGVAYGEKNWLLEISAAQILAFQPEILFVSNYTIFDASFIRHIRQKCASLRLVLGWCGAPYSDIQVFKEYDLLFSNIPELVAGFQHQGFPAFHVKHGFDPRLLTHLKTNATPHTDFAFIGSISKGEGFHNQREELLLYLIEHTPLEIWAEVPRNSFIKISRVKARQMVYDLAQKLNGRKWGDVLSFIAPLKRAASWSKRPALPATAHPRLRRVARPPLYGLDMFQQLRDTKVSLNTHIDISSQSASNMRLFEVTGVGSCLLTDWKDNISDLFEPDSEVVTYRSPQECVEKARFLLENENTRLAIALAGQNRTLQEHTVEQSVAQIEALIRDRLSKPHGR